MISFHTPAFAGRGVGGSASPRTASRPVAAPFAYASCASGVKGEGGVWSSSGARNPATNPCCHGSAKSVPAKGLDAMCFVLLLCLFHQNTITPNLKLRDTRSKITLDGTLYWLFHSTSLLRRQKKPRLAQTKH